MRSVAVTDDCTHAELRTPDHLSANDAANGLVEYMQTCREMRMHGTGGQRPAGFHYAGLEDFLLQHARFWTPAPLPSHVPVMTRNMCFANAKRLAGRRKDLRYVEGLAMGIIPVHHAWCVDADDNVIDPTWADTGIGVGDLYFGVTFPVTFVREATSSGCLSVLDNWKSRYDLYRRPYTA